MTFESFMNPLLRADEIEHRTTLMDKDVDKELTQEEIEELEKDNEEEVKKKTSLIY